MSQKFVPKGPINNIPASIQTMALRNYLNQRWLDYRRIYPGEFMSNLFRKLRCRQFYQNVTSYRYGDVIMTAMTSQITSLTTAYSAVYSSADQRKHQSSASLAFVRGIHRSPVNSLHKGPVTQKMVPFDDVIIVHCVDMKLSLHIHPACCITEAFTLHILCYSISFDIYTTSRPNAL